MKKLSVIVPVYNAEKYLPQCVESILKQSMSEIEVILVDDGSTDSSGLICEEYAKKDARVEVVHQKNMGLLDARRTGFLKSACKYVTTVDADDFIAPRSFRLAEASMEKGIDAIMFGITRYQDDHNQKMEIGHFPEGIYDRHKIEQAIMPHMLWNYERNQRGFDPSLCNKIVKRELMLSVYSRIPYGHLVYGEDSAVTYALIKEVSNLEIIAQSYYYHRQREGGAVAGYIKDEKYFDKLYALYCYLRKEFQSSSELLKQVEYMYMESASYRKWVYGDHKKSTQYLFPFDRVGKGEKIVLYGAGTVGQTYMEQLKMIDYCTPVLWIDKRYDTYAEGGVSPVEKIGEVVFDKIVIAILDVEVREAVKKELSNSGIDPDKILL